MPRKTKEPKELKKISRVDPEYLDDDSRIRLPGIQYWKYRALSAEIAKSALEYQKAKEDFESLVKATPALLAFRTVMAEARGVSAQLFSEMAEFYREVESKTGLDIKTCSLDDKTGHLNDLSGL
jgi:hypothetical protein